MNNLLHRPSPPPPPGPRPIVQRKVSVPAGVATFLFLFVLIYYCAVMLNQTYKNNVLWDELKLTSNEHALMVNSYLECRQKFFADSKSECHLLSLNYGRELGFENAGSIFSEIVALSQHSEGKGKN